MQASTVISNGVGRNLSVNPLYAGPYGILVSNVDFGTAAIPYGLSGAAPKVSSFFTFWNVKVRGSSSGWSQLQHYVASRLPVPPQTAVAATRSMRRRATVQQPQQCCTLHGSRVHALIVFPTLPLLLVALVCSSLQSARPLVQPRTMYGPRMSWIGTSLAPWTGVNGT